MLWALKDQPALLDRLSQSLEQARIGAPTTSWATCSRASRLSQRCPFCSALSTHGGAVKAVRQTGDCRGLIPLTPPRPDRDTDRAGGAARPPRALLPAQSGTAGLEGEGNQRQRPPRLPVPSQSRERPRSCSPGPAGALPAGRGHVGAGTGTGTAPRPSRHRPGRGGGSERV